MFYSHFCAYGRLNGSGDIQSQWNEVKDETPFRHLKSSGSDLWYHYQLDHGGALSQEAEDYIWWLGQLILPGTSFVINVVGGKWLK